MKNSTGWGTIFALLCIGVCSLSLKAQTPTGSVTGSITCADGDFPARGANVELIPLDRLLPRQSANPTTGSAPSTQTDFSGSYEIGSVAPGTYIVNAALDGYSDDLKLIRSVLSRYSVDDRRKLLGAFPQVTIKPGSEARKDLVIHRGASISGRVSVDLGGTAGTVRATATLISSSLIGGSSSDGKTEPLSYSQSAITDDRGNYRIAGLPSGKYRVFVVLKESFFAVKQASGGSFIADPQRTGVADLTVFSPESLGETDAKLFEVQDGDEVADADITIPSRNLHAIGGMVTLRGNAQGEIDVSLKRPDGSVQPAEAVSLPNGAYRFDLLPPGTYVIRAKPLKFSELGRSRLLGQATVRLTESDVLDANIEIRPEVDPNQ